MASGTIEFERSGMDSNGSYLVGKIEWGSTPNTEGNHSDVTASIYVRKDNDYLTLDVASVGSWRYGLTVNGQTVAGTTSASVLRDWVCVGTMTVSGISHDTEGVMSIELSGYVKGPPSSSYGTLTSSGSGTAELDTIPRSSEISNAAAAVLGESCSVTWVPASESFRYRLAFSMGEWNHITEVIHPASTEAYTYAGYTLPMEAAVQIPESLTGNMLVELLTYADENGSVQLGEASGAVFSVSMPDNEETRPEIRMTLSPEGSLPEAFEGLYLQGKTKIRAELEAAAKYGAEISRLTVTAEGSTYTGQSVTTAYLGGYGEITVRGTAVDSRGLSGSAEETVAVIPYSKPRILPASGEGAILAERCDADGNLTDSGTYLLIRAKRSYSKVVSGGSQRNYCQIQYRYRAEGGDYSAWVTILAAEKLDSDEVDTGPLLEGKLLATSTYQVQVRALDGAGESDSTTITVPTDKVYMHRDGARRSLGIGKYAEEEGCIDIAEDIRVRIRGEKWVSLGLSEETSASATGWGRGPTEPGCFYRVVNSSHVYVAFCCGLAYTGNAVTISAEAIPEDYRPSGPVRGICLAGDRIVAGVAVTENGLVTLLWAQELASGENTNEAEIEWIDGYIDYFV